MDAAKQKTFQPQKMGYFTDALLVNILDFPAYHIECISERHFLVAGGGGSSKTGVINQFNILELVPNDNSCLAEIVTKYTIPDDVSNEAIMNGAIMRDLPICNTKFVALGCQATIYHIRFNPRTRAFDINDYYPLQSPSPRTELKSIAYSTGRIYTGTVDGLLDVWDTGLNDKKLLKEFKSHNKEVDEIDIDTINQQIMTLSRGEARIILWNASNFEIIREFKKDFVNEQVNKTGNFYRSCRFIYDRLNSSNNNSGKGSVLLMATNSAQSKGTPSVSTLHRVSNIDSNSLNKFSNSVTTDGIMAMTVSLDGKNVAIGTRTGCVMILNTVRLNRIYKFEKAHQNSVTDLEFLPPKPESLVVTNSEVCPLISVSLDRRIVLHRPRKSSLGLTIVKIVFVIALIYLLAFSDIPFTRPNASPPIDA